jgi:hypothetical protein
MQYSRKCSLLSHERSPFSSATLHLFPSSLCGFFRRTLQQKKSPLPGVFKNFSTSFSFILFIYLFFRIWPMLKNTICSKNNNVQYRFNSNIRNPNDFVEPSKKLRQWTLLPASELSASAAVVLFQSLRFPAWSSHA